VAPDPEHDDKLDRLSSLRKKLSKLNRAPIPASAPRAMPGAAPDAIVYRRDLPREAPRRVPEGGGICIPLEKCVEGCEAASPRGASFYLIEKAIDEAELHDVSTALPRALEELSQQVSAVVAPEHICFLDIETTGLGTATTFLIGTLVWHEGVLVCRQFLARSYAEEAAILEHYAEQSRGKPLVVTFNGKTFDVPSLRARAAATGAPFREPALHFDLLHVSRRHFADKLPDCKLQTLERRVCGRHRGEDIPGSDIGRAYHDFVRTGDAREIALIVSHNKWDLVTMAHLMTRILVPRAACRVEEENVKRET